jgi:hypothetical protein
MLAVDLALQHQESQLRLVSSCWMYANNLKNSRKSDGSEISEQRLLHIIQLLSGKQPLYKDTGIKRIVGINSEAL